MNLQGRRYYIGGAICVDTVRSLLKPRLRMKELIGISFAEDKRNLP
jgi:hypothetical protein